MAIDWYPGHMKKARLQIAEVMPTVDLIIEVLDARLPASSANPLLEKLRGVKPCIKVLNKNDLADPNMTRLWVRHFEKQQGVKALPLEARQRKEVGLLPKLCRRLVPHRGKPGKPLRAMVVGIPNVGKSTLINTMAGKKMARVGDKPAITTCPQQIDLRNGILLSDTPGLLWPVMESQEGVMRLATSGAIGDSAYDFIEVAEFATTFLIKQYPASLKERYRIENIPLLSRDLLEEIGRRRGCLLAGGEVDVHRAAEILLRELRGGKLGRISLEWPGLDKENKTDTDEADDD